MRQIGEIELNQAIADKRRVEWVIPRPTSTEPIMVIIDDDQPGIYAPQATASGRHGRSSASAPNGISSTLP